MAQYFTPFPVASCMAKLSFSPDVFEQKNIVRVCEPAAGSGVMILAFMLNVLEENPEYLKKLSLTCIDLNYMCVKMSTLQIMASCFVHQDTLGQLMVLRGNSLGDPKNLDTFYHVSTLDFKAAEKAEEEAEVKEKPEIKKSLVIEDIETPETFDIQPKKQMNIFDFCRN